MIEFTIKKIAISENLPIVDELVGELHDSEKGFNSKTEDWSVFKDKYLEHMLECEQENEASFIIAEHEGKAIGFVFGYIEEQDESDFEVGDGDDLYVSEGYVKSEFRKHGIYSALNAAFEKEYENFNIRRIYRYTLNNNETMKSWLSKQGYEPVRIVYEKWLK